MTTVSPDLIDWRERQYVSQYSMPPLTFQIHIAGQLADPDGQQVTAQLARQNADGTTTVANSYTAIRESPGNYTVTPSSADTATPCDAQLTWSYSISGQAQTYVSYLVIGQANPAYDSLPLEMQDYLESQVWVRFADLFDSPAGGPNLQAYYQAHWSRGRVAQLMGIAVQKINGVAQPWSNYTIDGSGGPQFPIAIWGGLLAEYTFVEGIKNLIRAYTEQPSLMGGGVTRLDRRDYSDRWREVLRDETAELKSMLDVFKIRHIMNGSPRVLVSGGTYGRYAPTRIAGSVAARPRMWARWRRGTKRLRALVCPHAISGRSSLFPGPSTQRCKLPCMNALLFPILWLVFLPEDIRDWRERRRQERERRLHPPPPLVQPRLSMDLTVEERRRLDEAIDRIISESY